MTALRFTKMHGAGNDFVVLDAIAAPFSLPLSAGQIRLLADRRRGVGFDQLLLLRPSADPRATFAYDIYNTDGSTAQQCGNGARCVAAWLAQEHALSFPNHLLSPSGLVGVRLLVNGQIGVELAGPGSSVPAQPLTRQYASSEWSFDPVDMGNPHLVTPVTAVAQAPVQQLGAALNTDPLLPAGVNVEFVEICADGLLKVRVYERGVGETLACGSGACAVAVVAIRRGWVNDRHAVQIQMPGGLLSVSWPHDAAPVVLSGPVCRVFEGTLHSDFLSLESSTGAPA